MSNKLPKLSLKLQYYFRIISLFDSVVPRTYRNLILRSSADSSDYGSDTYIVKFAKLIEIYIRDRVGE